MATVGLATGAQAGPGALPGAALVLAACSWRAFDPGQTIRIAITGDGLPVRRVDAWQMGPRC